MQYIYGAHCLWNSTVTQTIYYDWPWRSISDLQWPNPERYTQHLQCIIGQYPTSVFEKSLWPCDPGLLPPKSYQNQNDKEYVNFVRIYRDFAEKSCARKFGTDELNDNFSMKCIFSGFVLRIQNMFLSLHALSFIVYAWRRPVTKTFAHNIEKYCRNQKNTQEILLH